MLLQTDCAHGQSKRLAALLRRRDEVLLELAVGVGVGCEPETAAGINDVECAESHAAAKFFAGLAKAERLAKRGETGLEVGDGLQGEVVVQIWGEKRAVDTALLQAAVNVEGLLLRSAERIAGDDDAADSRVSHFY